MRGETADERFQRTHKEESAAHSESNKKDRDGIREMIDMCIPLLSVDAHPY